MEKLYFFAFLFWFSPTFSQFNNIVKKTNFVYAHYSFDLKYNDRTYEYDTIGKKREKNWTIAIDTVIKLTGKDRKLIIFSKCIDDDIFGGDVPRIIVRGKIEDLPKNESGILDYSGFQKLPENLKSSIVYQVGTETYSITTPINFFKPYLENKNKLAEFDKVLLNLDICKSCNVPVIINNYIYIENVSLPIRMFMELSKKIKFDNNEDTTSSFAPPGEGFFAYHNSTKRNIYRAQSKEQVDWYSPSLDYKFRERYIVLNKDFQIIEVHYKDEANSISDVYYLIKVE
jgi:hypothetical protein